MVIIAVRYTSVLEEEKADRAHLRHRNLLALLLLLCSLFFIFFTAKTQEEKLC